MKNDILIDVDQLSRFYPGTGNNKTLPGKTIAVDNISFTLKRGEVLGFLGPNGAGKSTTMKMLTGNLAPSQGRIKIGGIDLMDNPIEAKALIGFLPDTPPLYKDLSVNEYLHYCAQLNRISKAKITQAIERCKERCGLSEHGQRIIAHLSKGYQQRVGIAQAIIHAPDIVILDEPTVGLDPIQMIEIRKLIKELGETHSVMLSSHILPEIQAVCNNVQIINQGQLIFNASIEQLSQQMKTQTLRMSCTQSISINEIEALSTINRVEYESTHPQSLILHCATTISTAENDSFAINAAQQVITLATEKQWGLYEIYPEKRTLEDIFMSLTQSDPTMQQHAQIGTC
jgi:ABC-2 type transport system ATP-binding protein